jgi:predicted acetyltransferase
MARLETPAETWRESYLEALEEYHQEGRYLEYDPVELRRDFPAFIRRIAGYSRGEGLPEGFVPSSDYWLIDDDQFIGRVAIRHQLNDWLIKVGGNIGYDIRPSKRRMGYGTQILALALPKAREIGLTRALVTCDEDNIGSRKIIKANDGKFENRLMLVDDRPAILRYWIDLSQVDGPSAI